MGTYNKGNFSLTYDVDTITDSIIITNFNTTSSSNILVEIPSIIESKPVTAIANNAFKNATKISTLILPGDLVDIGSGAFQGCTSLTNLALSDHITHIGYMAFYDTPIYGQSSKWEDGHLYIGNYLIRVGTNKTGSYIVKSGTVTIADNAFYKCSSITNVTIPDSVVSIGNHTFESCTGLTNITLGSKVREIGYQSFYGCSNLISIDIPNRVQHISYEAFSGCTSLKEVHLSTNIKAIDASAFQDCASINYVNIPTIQAWCNINFTNPSSNPAYYAGNLHVNGVILTEVTKEDNITELNPCTFVGCEALTNVYIPDGINIIPYNCFYGCTLETLSIGKDLSYIMYDAFIYSTVNDIYYRGSKSQRNSLLTIDETGNLVLFNYATWHYSIDGYVIIDGQPKSIIEMYCIQDNELSEISDLNMK